MSTIQHLRYRLSHVRRRMFEAFGSDRYSRPALHDLESKLQPYVNFRGGFFIEAGANDGFNQSNTYYLEHFMDWTGILVEGIPELYAKCVKRRPRARVFNKALVAHDFPGDTVTMHYAGPMSLISGARKSSQADHEHVNRWSTMESDAITYSVDVPACTLTDILDEVRPKQIDLLSLDVEGYELQVLRGLDLARYRPAYILVEANFRREIEGYLTEHGYELIDAFTHHDLLFRSP